jgi:hypothetical protein
MTHVLRSYRGGFAKISELALPVIAYAISKANYDTVRAKILRRER